MTIEVSSGFSKRGELLRNVNRAVISCRGNRFGTKWETPKSYKRVGVIGTEFANAYNSGLMTIYRANDGSFRFEMYRDGSFLPYYGKIEFIG